MAYEHSSKMVSAEFFKTKESENDYKVEAPVNGENINILIRRENGYGIHLKDYASCGKENYTEIISVWLSLGIRDRLKHGVRAILAPFSSIVPCLRKR